MPSMPHETVIDLFRNRPTLAATLIHGQGMTPARYDEVRVESENLVDCKPTEYRADAVIVHRAENKPVLGVVLEVQIRPDDDKRWSWPVYLATLRARLQCDTALLVMCLSRATARKCAVPIDMGHPGWRLAPLVMGPDQLPRITDVAQAIAEPELAALSVVAHGRKRGPAGQEAMDVFCEAAPFMADGLGSTYADVVLALLPKVAARRFMEGLMAVGTDKYKSDYVRQWVAEGEAKGLAEGEAKGEAKGLAEGEAKARAKDIVLAFRTRGIDVPPEAEQRILECSDTNQLSVWFPKSITASSVEELFDSE
ncbi:hypothetical protein ACFXJ8_41655 [Nonomuraea sp. NPDC059194]|uniref:hypothetical protein n=1 Tax=Nonomuraea sp. NPDC059194 TaxID=3346764 RepID=UPI00369A2802